jgi:hypothetical protein
MFGVFCSSRYAVSGLLVGFTQKSKSPVRRTHTFTLPPSKHWSQLFIANAEFELQFTGLYSPREDPAEADTSGAAGRVGASSVVVVSAAGGGGISAHHTSPSTANALE